MTPTNTITFDLLEFDIEKFHNKIERIATQLGGLYSTQTKEIYEEDEIVGHEVQVSHKNDYITGHIPSQFWYGVYQLFGFLDKITYKYDKTEKTVSVTMHVPLKKISDLG